MFCTECGAKLPEGTRFCVHCGTPVATSPAAGGYAEESPVIKGYAAESPSAGGYVAESPVVEGPPVENPAAENPVISVVNDIKKKFNIKLENKKLFQIGAVALIGIVLLMFVFGGSSGGFSSPEKAFEAYLNGYSQQDYDLLFKTLPDFYIEYYGGKGPIKKNFQSNYESQLADYAAAGYEFRYDATGHTMLSKEEAKKIAEDIQNAFDTKAKISSVATVDYRLVMIHDGKESPSDSASVGKYAFKYNGKWYYLNT